MKIPLFLSFFIYVDTYLQQLFHCFKDLYNNELNNTKIIFVFRIFFQIQLYFLQKKKEVKYIEIKIQKYFKSCFVSLIF